jgi:hypothetical protein
VTRAGAGLLIFLNLLRNGLFRLKLDVADLVQLTMRNLLRNQLLLLISHDSKFLTFYQIT